VQEQSYLLSLVAVLVADFSEILSSSIDLMFFGDPVMGDVQIQHSSELISLEL